MDVNGLQGNGINHSGKREEFSARNWIHGGFVFVHKIEMQKLPEQSYGLPGARVCGVAPTGLAGAFVSAAAAATITTASATRRLFHTSFNILRRLRFHAGLLEKAEIVEPIQKAVRPCAILDESAISQTAGGRRFVGTDFIAGMMASGVNVHFNIRHSGVQHCREIFIRPNCVSFVAPARAGDE